jgi:hypothetical protein
VLVRWRWEKGQCQKASQELADYVNSEVFARKGEQTWRPGEKKRRKLKEDSLKCERVASC